MPSVTADTNIYISAFEFGGLPRRFVDFAAAGDFGLDISDAILNEVLRVLSVKFQWNAEEMRGVEEDIRSYARLVTPTQTLYGGIRIVKVADFFELLKKAQT